MKTEKKQYGWLRVIIFVILAVVGVIIRSIFATKIVDVPILINNALLLDSTNSSMGMITMESLYTAIFALFFSLVGNKVELAIYFQIILEVLAIVVLFFSIKKITNKICAWICYLVFICVPVVFLISINQLFFIIFSIFFAIAALYVHIVSKINRTITVKWIASMFVSFIFTRLLLLDSIYIVFLVFGLFIALFYSESTKESLFKTKSIMIISYLFGIFLSLALCFATKIVLGKEKLFSLFQDFTNSLFISNPEYKMYFNDYKFITQEYKILVYCVIGIFSLFMILSFFQKTRKNTISITILLINLNLYWIFFQTGINPYMVTVALAWIVFVLGIQGFIYLLSYKKIKVIDMLEEEPIEEPIPSVVIKKPKYIENPLPVPKKHIPKILDYRMEPSSEDMHYNLDDE